MSLILLPNATGIDYWVQMFQQNLYNYLLTQWTVTTDTYNCFGRAYRNKTKDGYIPEFYNPATQSYVAGDLVSAQGGMFFEDSLAAMSFFGMDDPVKVNVGVNRAKMQLLFFVDLGKITPGGLTVEQQQGQRLDEVAINDVKNLIQLMGSGFEVVAEYRDINKVLERYSGTIKNQMLNYDMHPRFCFRIDLEINYNSYLNTAN